MIIKIPSKQQVYIMYPDLPRGDLRERMINIMTSDRTDLRRLHKHVLYPKEWQVLREEIGEPTHDANGKPIQCNDMV